MPPPGFKMTFDNGPCSQNHSHPTESLPGGSSNMKQEARIRPQEHHTDNDYVGGNWLYKETASEQVDPFFDPPRNRDSFSEKR